jgi:hypothetical protein
MKDYHEMLAESPSLLCVELSPKGEKQLNYQFLQKVIERTAECTAAYQFVFPFFLVGGSYGMTMLNDMIDFVHKRKRPVILDGNWGDNAKAAQANADAIFKSSTHAIGLS